MNKKILKIIGITFGVVLVGYGSWRIAEYFMGITRLKYATYKKINFEEPPINSEDVE